MDHLVEVFVRVTDGYDRTGEELARMCVRECCVRVWCVCVCVHMCICACVRGLVHEVSYVWSECCLWSAATNHFIPVECIDSLTNGGRRWLARSVHKQAVCPHLGEHTTDSERICDDGTMMAAYGMYKTTGSDDRLASEQVQCVWKSAEC